MFQNQVNMSKFGQSSTGFGQPTNGFGQGFNGNAFQQPQQHQPPPQQPIQNLNQQLKIDDLTKTLEEQTKALRDQINSNKLLEEGVKNLIPHVLATETIIHQGIHCKSCNQNPIKGLRFKCMHCADYDLCFNCYVTINTSNNSTVHDATHHFLCIKNTTEYNLLSLVSQQNK